MTGHQTQLDYCPSLSPDTLAQSPHANSLTHWPSHHMPNCQLLTCSYEPRKMMVRPLA
eukprot:CAMPEP_0202900800 /NCGR_PEP_ID=MMETSP1392-20130828/12043_1 /ASSEMBLY_ACC=CAM_ASM_000868 /TAXON_ID=225041 /ORGANISM="Chlamydomonas chlamydogama, Strain SAG 11-48b" /LENGTH=57 /DNA_ID=CAMNT_0049587245 /DNA_START=132 /DNA_END=301 /DNA_ORIENTATION=-